MLLNVMFVALASSNITREMYLPSQNVVAEFMEVESYGGLFGESASHQSYKYSGKELERMNGLNTYDFHARPYYYPALQFHSPDILGEKTPWLSPYLYCAGNTIMLIDPTGMEWLDIYAIKKGEAVLIGYNGVDDNDVYVVTRDVKKAVEKATKNGNAYTGVLRVGDNSVVHWDEGGEPVVTETESRISINYFKIGDKVKIPNNVSNVAFYWHTHPKRGESNLSSHGSSKPSEADKKFQKDMQQSGYKGNAFIIGLRENKVTFYNKNKNIITIPYPVFVNLGNR